ncbi:unnamed protein product [Arctia plantaginis]|uniref:Uncharacterized protein n=1 Tax=Arctia plantaginis TaxID=874455 RepID=A0A8S1B5Z9_ARCPL|nr:unnamed protein product [Arctia plantaginis]
MYRQVKVAREDTDCQRILWRKDQRSEIEHYRMLNNLASCLAFGVASAPYLEVTRRKLRMLHSCVMDSEGKVDVALISSKTKVAPM